MKVTNYYERIRTNLVHLNNLQKGFFCIRMDGELIQLHDCCRNKVVLSYRCVDIDKFCQKLYIFREAFSVYMSAECEILQHKPFYQKYIKLINSIYHE